MTLVKRGKVYHTRMMFDGKLYQQSLHTTNKNEAIKLESVFRTSLVRGEFGIIDGRQSPTLSQFEEKLLPHLKANTAPRTYGFYKENLAALNRYEPLAKSRLHKIDQALIERFTQFRLKDGKDGKSLTATTVNHSLRTLRRVLRLARDWKLIRDVPRIKLLPGEHEREYVIDEADLTRMVKHTATAYPTSQMQFLLPFLVDTGLRITEACGLKKEHIRYEDGQPHTVRIVKGKSKYAKREIPLTARAASAAESALKQSKSDWVFTSKGGRRALTRHYPSEIFRMLRDTLNMGDCVLHSTRHTFCTRLGKAGADAFTIQKLAGHSSITISQRYVHADREIKEAAIGLLNALNTAPKPKGDGTIKEI